MSLHSREGSNHIPEQRNDSTQASTGGPMSLLGLFMEVQVTQRQMLYQKVHPGMSNDSGKLRPWSFPCNEKGTPATIVSFLQQLLLLIKWGGGGCEPSISSFLSLRSSFLSRMKYFSLEDRTYTGFTGL